MLAVSWMGRWLLLKSWELVVLRGPMFGAGSVQAQEHLGFEGRGGGSRKSEGKPTLNPEMNRSFPALKPKTRNPLGACGSQTLSQKPSK